MTVSRVKRFYRATAGAATPSPSRRAKTCTPGSPAGTTSSPRPSRRARRPRLERDPLPLHLRPCPAPSRRRTRPRSSSPPRARRVPSRCPAPGTGSGTSWTSRAGPASPPTRPPTTSTSSCPPSSWPGPGAGLFVDVEYYGDRFGQFRLQYVSHDRAATLDGLYKNAEQRWSGDAAGLSRFRRALFALPDFDPGRTQNQGASFRLEFRSDLRVSRRPGEPQGRPRTGRPSRRWLPCPSSRSSPAASTPSTTSSSRSPTPATSSAPGAPTTSWSAAAAS